MGILSVGILHGANDLLIINRFTSATAKHSFVYYFIIYIGVVFLVALMFYMVPAFGLGFFILFSGYHFGEQHWENKALASSNPMLLTMYGLVVFFLLFTLNYKAVYPVIEAISGYTLSYDYFFWPLVVMSLTVLIWMLSTKQRIYLFQELLLFSVLALLFYSGKLLLSFGYYFVFWHSIPSLRSQVKYLYNTQQSSGFKTYFKKGLPYWILALAGLIFFFTFTNLNADYILPLFFIFLGAITFPHAVVMGLMFKDKRSSSTQE